VQGNELGHGVQVVANRLLVIASTLLQEVSASRVSGPALNRELPALAQPLTEEAIFTVVAPIGGQACVVAVDEVPESVDIDVANVHGDPALERVSGTGVMDRARVGQADRDS
jgi:hypothetical protein